MTQQVLKEDDYQKILSGLEAAEEAIRQAEMGIRAGMKFEPQLQRAKEQKDQLLRLKNTYFTGR